MTKKDEVKKSIWQNGFGIASIIIFALMFCSILIVVTTWRDAIEKQYLSSLTPKERAEIQAQAEIQQQQEQQLKEQNGKALEEFINYLFGWNIPFWLVLMIICVTWYIANKRWYY
jgi:flagellar biosynthesis/type III secretory pathway M-ring protein FliF/YscJ